MIGSVVATVTTYSDTFIIMPILIACGIIAIFGNNFGVSGPVMIGSVVVALSLGALRYLMKVYVDQF